MSALLKGIILGVSIAAPVGPIGLLCIRKTLSQGRAVGFVSGLGAATADAIYGYVAAFGLTLVTRFLIKHSAGIGLVGALFLLYLAYKTRLGLVRLARGRRIRRVRGVVIVGYMRKMIGPSVLKGVNYASGIVLSAFGLYGLNEGFRTFL